MKQDYFDVNQSTLPHFFNEMIESIPQKQPSIILVAIRDDFIPSMIGDLNSLQRMRAISIDPDDITKYKSSICESWVNPVFFIPNYPPFSTINKKTLHHRLVEGDILLDEKGILYEKIGNRIRILQHLFSGPNGEIIEILPPKKRIPEKIAQIENLSKLNSEIEQDEQKVKYNNLYQKNKCNHQRDKEKVLSFPIRKLLPEWGVLRKVRFGDYKKLLTRQLASPDQLDDNYRILCYVQVYEILKKFNLKLLTNRTNNFIILNTQVAQQLKLERFVRKSIEEDPLEKYDQNLLFPHDKVIQLRVAEDPTFKENISNSEIMQSFKPIQNCKIIEKTQSLKTSLPRQFLKPHEFKFSREEVIYDIQVERNRKKILKRLVLIIKSWLWGRLKFQKWQTLLQNKSSDEQLWQVHPPEGMLLHPSVRDWAYQKLIDSGYNVNTMLIEWEIFWRRKGHK